MTPALAAAIKRLTARIRTMAAAERIDPARVDRLAALTATTRLRQARERAAATTDASGPPAATTEPGEHPALDGPTGNGTDDLAAWRAAYGPHPEPGPRARAYLRWQVCPRCGQRHANPDQCPEPAP